MSLPRLSRKTVEQRRSRADAALIIDNVVYDVTHFLDKHPGGPDFILDNLGRDASEIFRDVGHSADARVLMKGLAVAELVEEDCSRVQEIDQSRVDEASTRRRRSDVYGFWYPLMVIILYVAICYTYIFF